MQSEPRLKIALFHEFLRCEDAFDRFAALASRSVFSELDRHSNFVLYNRYAQFVHHLYEFYRGCIELDKRQRKIPAVEKIDAILDSELEKAIRNRRATIKGGYAAPEENGLDAYPVKDRRGFGKKFREIRNLSFAHVSEERSDVDLSEFYQDHHRDLMLLYYQAAFSWRQPDDEFPELGRMTSFRPFGQMSADV